MNDSPLQTAMREMQSLITSRQVWIGMGAAGVILGLAGPFGTDVLGLVPRLTYWLFVSVMGFMVGSLVSTIVAESLRARAIPMWLSVVIAGSVAGVVLLGQLILINWLVFRLSPSEPGYLTGLGINVVVISVIIAGAYVSIQRGLPHGDTPETPPAPTPPRLLDRLPLEKRGPLISISVQDHYVEVVTAKGRELILLRLSDAMAEVGDTPGLQVHRSHWIATSAVQSVRRDGARAILTMAGGSEIPVSRTYIPAIKEAGLLPR